MKKLLHAVEKLLWAIYIHMLWTSCKLFGWNNYETYPSIYILWNSYERSLYFHSFWKAES